MNMKAKHYIAVFVLLVLTMYISPRLFTPLERRVETTYHERYITNYVNLTNTLQVVSNTHNVYQSVRYITNIVNITNRTEQNIYRSQLVTRTNTIYETNYIEFLVYTNIWHQMWAPRIEQPPVSVSGFDVYRR